MIRSNVGYRTKSDIDSLFTDAISEGRSIEKELSQMHSRQQAD